MQKRNLSNPECKGTIYKQFLDSFEPQLLKDILTQTRGNILKASILLGISRTTLRKKLAQHKINAKTYKEMPRPMLGMMG